MVKMMTSLFYKFFCVFLLSFLIVLSACGKRGALERPSPQDNLEPAIVEENK